MTIKMSDSLGAYSFIRNTIFLKGNILVLGIHELDLRNCFLCFIAVDNIFEFGGINWIQIFINLFICIFTIK